MIVLQDTGTEYLLTIEYRQRDRAKSIAGFSWDKHRRCWSFPRTQEVYNALIEEFCEDLQGEIPSEPSLSQLGGRGVGEIKRLIEQASHALAASQPNSEELEIQLLSVQLALDESLREKTELEDQIDRLHSELQSSRSAAHSKDVFDSINEIVRTVCDDQELLEVAQQLRTSPLAVIDLGKLVENRLRNVVCADDYLSFHDVIQQAREHGVLRRGELFSLANTIRNLRNTVAHEQRDSSTHVARSLVALLAASMLFRELKSSV